MPIRVAPCARLCRPDTDLEKVAVVRNENESIGISGQVLLKPVTGFEIEMIGRLVEQQQIGLLQQEFRESDAHLPAAGKFFGRSRPVVAVEAKSGEDLTNLRFERVAVAGDEFVFELLITVGDVGVFGARVVEFRHASGERLHFFLDGVEFGKHRHALGKNGTAGHREAVLRKVSRGNALGARDGAVVERLAAGKNLHDGGFASTVRSDQTDARFRRDQPVGVLEQKLVAVALPGAGKLDHGVSLFKYSGRELAAAVSSRLSALSEKSFDNVSHFVSQS